MTVKLPFLLLSIGYFLGEEVKIETFFKITYLHNWMHKEFSFRCRFGSSHSISGFHVLHLFIALHIICNDSGRQ